jgi:hypothetical protein
MNRLLHGSRPSRLRGFLMLDAVIGMAMATLLLLSLSAAIAQQHTAEKRLAALRSATRHAEAILLEMQAGASAPGDARVERLPAAAPPNQVWVRLTLPSRPSPPIVSGDLAPEAPPVPRPQPSQSNLHVVSLVGLVPASTLDQGTRP